MQLTGGFYEVAKSDRRPSPSSQIGASSEIIWDLRRTKTEVVVVILPRANKSVQVLTAGLLAGRADAPNRISDVIGNQKRSGLVDGESDRPSARLPVRVKKIGDDILSFAIGTPAAEGHENDLVTVEGRPVPTSVFADERAAAIFLWQAVGSVENEAQRRHVRA